LFHPLLRTFAAYLLEQRELLNDCFGSAQGAGAIEEGDAGFFVYEELPHAERKAGITGCGLTGVSNLVLKVLGV